MADLISYTINSTQSLSVAHELHWGICLLKQAIRRLYVKDECENSGQMHKKVAFCLPPHLSFSTSVWGTLVSKATGRMQTLTGECSWTSADLPWVHLSERERRPKQKLSSTSPTHIKPRFQRRPITKMMSTRNKGGKTHWKETITIGVPHFLYLCQFACVVQLRKDLWSKTFSSKHSFYSRRAFLVICFTVVVCPERTQHLDSRQSDVTLRGFVICQERRQNGSDQGLWLFFPAI